MEKKCEEVDRIKKKIEEDRNNGEKMSEICEKMSDG
jgi:hypothetical protein